jgi:polyamine oxidase
MRTIFSTSVDFAQENSNSVPDEAESLGSYILDEKRSTLFEGLETEQEKQCAVQMQASWDGWTGADLKNISLKYWQSDVTFEGGDATIVDGYKGIYEPLAASIRQHSSSDIKLNSEVVSIAYDQDSETVTVQTKDANDEDETASATATYTASYVVCTLPLGVLQNRPPKFSPPLSARRAQALNRLQMGLLNKVMITYTNCFWPPTQTFLSFLPSPASRAFLPNLQNRALFAQNYKPITGKNTLVFYIGGDTGAELEDLTDEEAKEKLHAVLKHHFGHEETFPAKDDEGPIAFTVTRWLKDPYSQGAYSYIRPAKEGEKDVPTPYDYAELSRPAWDRRLFFAGEGTDPDHYVRSIMLKSCHSRFDPAGTFALMLPFLSSMLCRQLFMEL